MFFGLDMEKLLLIGVVAVVVLGPERLPQYAEMLGRFTVRAREWLRGAKTRVKEEMGEDFDDVEWRKLDPRQYDPRRIIRDALLEEPAVPAVAAASVLHPAPGASGPLGGITVASDPIGGASTEQNPTAGDAAKRTPTVPFDSEAT
ncbi:twin-arginine translocase TatA/TatE family subunit [Microbacterium sp.]|uniref:twin-arginine translocase TatA/TatE family subunit n=1 Tax=Microbacterium sp. TaxID=51671 RepID=UPI0039E4E37D